MTISPSEAVLVEGTGISLEALDQYGKPIEVAWTVTPAGCGEFAATQGDQTSFVAATDVAPVQCRVTATVSGVTANATVIVNHDISSGTVELSSGGVTAGGAVEVAAFDRYGHALAFEWTVTPSTCGQFDVTVGPQATLTTDSALGEVVCTITATYGEGGTLTLRTLVSIELGPPASIEVTFVGAAPEGGQTEARATVRDAGGHALDSSAVTWTTTCESLSRTSGATTLVTVSQNGAGTTCAVTASLGPISGTGDLQIVRGPAARIEISPSSISASNGERVTVSVKAWDQYNHELTPSTVIWAASCGSFEGEGATVTYVAPASGGPCQITATVPGASTGVSAGAGVTVGSGLLLPLALVAVIGVAAVAGVFLMRRRKGGT